MKFLAILLVLIIALSASLKRKRRSRGGSGYININVIVLWVNEQPRTIIGQTTLFVNYYDSTIEFSNKADQQNTQNLHLTFDIDGCQHDLSSCKKPVSPYLVEGYNFISIANANQDANTLEEIKNYKAQRKLHMLTMVLNANFNDDANIIKFEYMNKYFLQLSCLSWELYQLWKNYLGTMKNLFFDEEIIIQSQIKDNNIHKEFSDKWEEHARNVIYKINKSENSQEEIYKGWTYFKTYFKREYSNNADSALYSWVLVHSIKSNNREFSAYERTNIYQFILKTVMIGPDPQNPYKLFGNISFQSYPIGVLNLANMNQYELSYKAHLTSLIRNLVTNLQTIARDQIKPLISQSPI
jgi:hypothetical protein